MSNVLRLGNESGNPFIKIVAEYLPLVNSCLYVRDATSFNEIKTMIKGGDEREPLLICRVFNSKTGILPIDILATEMSESSKEI